MSLTTLSPPHLGLPLKGAKVKRQSPNISVPKKHSNMYIHVCQIGRIFKIKAIFYCKIWEFQPKTSLILKNSKKNFFEKNVFFTYFCIFYYLLHFLTKVKDYISHLFFLNFQNLHSYLLLYYYIERFYIEQFKVAKKGINNLYKNLYFI